MQHKKKAILSNPILLFWMRCGAHMVFEEGQKAEASPKVLLIFERATHKIFQGDDINHPLRIPH